MCVCMGVWVLCVCALKDVVKLQDENTSLRSGLQQLELSTTQQTKTIKVLCRWCHMFV